MQTHVESKLYKTGMIGICCQPFLNFLNLKSSFTFLLLLNSMGQIATIFYVRFFTTEGKITPLFIYRYHKKCIRPFR